jgi:hypothetical protein
MKSMHDIALSQGSPAPIVKQVLGGTSLFFKHLLTREMYFFLSNIAPFYLY